MRERGELKKKRDREEREKLGEEGKKGLKKELEETERVGEKRGGGGGGGNNRGTITVKSEQVKFKVSRQLLHHQGPAGDISWVFVCVCVLKYEKLQRHSMRTVRQGRDLRTRREPITLRNKGRRSKETV